MAKTGCLTLRTRARTENGDEKLNYDYFCCKIISGLQGKYKTLQKCGTWPVENKN